MFIYCVHWKIKYVNNQQLIPEGTEVKEGPYIVFSLMGHSVNSQSLSGYEQGSNKVNSSVVIRVRSTILMLSAYFKQSPDAQLKLMVNDDKVLGSSSLHLQVSVCFRTSFCPLGPLVATYCFLLKLFSYSLIDCKI